MPPVGERSYPIELPRLFHVDTSKTKELDQCQLTSRHWYCQSLLTCATHPMMESKIFIKALLRRGRAELGELAPQHVQVLLVQPQFFRSLCAAGIGYPQYPDLSGHRQE